MLAINMYLYLTDNPCEPNPCGSGGSCLLQDSGLANCSCFDNFTLAGGDGACISAIGKHIHAHMKTRVFIAS